jgi:hypothetical protein
LILSRKWIEAFSEDKQQTN